ncbi:MAG TPA: 4Fe-4S dicluster domain-containing protein [Thermoleophilia bacterium]|nr:4Fe-4S dicluster domain-containing protein [Thermoleophilia bacterium]
MRAPTKAMTNYVVDLIIAAAFIGAAVSGIVFLLPTAWVSTSRGDPAMLGVGMAVWRTLHEWSSLIMIGGVLLHTVLHWRWVVAMTKKAFAPPRRERRAAARPHAVRPDAARPGAALPDIARPVPVALQPVDAGPPSAPGAALQPPGSSSQLPFGGGPRTVADASSPPAVVVYRCDEARPRRRTRREVLAGLGMVGAAVVTGGLAGRALADQWLERSASAEGVGGDEESGSGEALASSDDGLSASDGSSVADDTSSDGAATGDGAGSSSSLTADRVVIDEGRCNGCGHCLPSCPYGVFDWGGSVAVVADANACRLCGRCLQVCPTTAITLNA